MHRVVLNHASFAHLHIHQGALDLFSTTYHEALIAKQPSSPTAAHCWNCRFMYPTIHWYTAERPSSKQPAGYLHGEATGTEASGHAIMVVPTLKGHSTLTLKNLLDLSGDNKRCTVCEQVQFRQFVNKVLRQEIDHVLVGLMVVRSHRKQRGTSRNKGERLK